MAARATSTCEVCERTAPVRTHPCRFATACACWRGVPCHTIGKAIRLDPTDDRRPIGTRTATPEASR